MGNKAKSWSLIWSASVVFCVMICGLINPFVSKDAAIEISKMINLGPSLFDAESSYLLGTDGLGRSIALRLFKGVEVFFFPGLIAGGVAVFFGSVLGALCGY